MNLSKQYWGQSLVFHDTISVEALFLDVAAANRLKRGLWHEVGHVLGLDHPAQATGGMMEQMPTYTSQTDIGRGKTLVENMHWLNDEATGVRQSYAPNAQ